MLWCTFTDPESTRVGLNDKKLPNKLLLNEVTQYEINNLGQVITAKGGKV